MICANCNKRGIECEPGPAGGKFEGGSSGENNSDLSAQEHVHNNGIVNEQQPLTSPPHEGRLYGHNGVYGKTATTTSASDPVRESSAASHHHQDLPAMAAVPPRGGHIISAAAAEMDVSSSSSLLAVGNETGSHFGPEIDSISNTDWLRYDLYSMESMVDGSGNTHSSSAYGTHSMENSNNVYSNNNNNNDDGNNNPAIVPTTSYSHPPLQQPQQMASTYNHPTPATLPIPQLDNNDEDNWPFSYRKTPGKSQMVLPPIRWESGNFGMPENNRNRNDDDDTMRKAFTNLLSQPYTCDRWPVEESKSIDSFFPGSDILDEFIKLFFDNFSNICPIIHRPTWKKKSAPLLELAAVISIGAGFSQRPEAHLFADNLSELVKRTINWNVDRDRGCLKEEDFLSAMLLQSIYALGSGNKSLYEVADSSRSLLVTSARAYGLFNLNFSDFGPMNWVTYERRKRISWLIFEFDCTVCTLTSSRPCMSLHDLNNNLPCDDEVWECRQPWKDGLKFKHTLSDLLHDYNTPVETVLRAASPYSRRLITQALGRSVWDYVELESTMVFRMLYLPETPKKNLLVAMDHIVQNLTAPRQSDSYHITMMSMIVSYSHLYSHHVIELITSATRQPDLKKIELVLSSLNQRPETSRFLAWHSCQIIAIIRCAPIHAPCETMRLFMAGLFLYWFALSRPASVPGSSMIPLDIPPWGGTSKLPSNWIKYGGPACVSDKNSQYICISGKGGANSVIDVIVDLLVDLSVWGLADRFCNILTTMKDLTSRLQQ